MSELLTKLKADYDAADAEFQKHITVMKSADFSWETYDGFAGDDVDAKYASFDAMYETVQKAKADYERELRVDTITKQYQRATPATVTGDLHPAGGNPPVQVFKDRLSAGRSADGKSFKFDVPFFEKQMVQKAPFSVDNASPAFPADGITGRETHHQPAFSPTDILNLFMRVSVEGSQMGAVDWVASGSLATDRRDTKETPAEMSNKMTPRWHMTVERHANAPIPNGWISDDSRIETEAYRLLYSQGMDDMADQVLNGAGSGNDDTNIQGALVQCTEVWAITASTNMWTDLEAQVLDMFEHGVYPTAILVTATDYKKLRAHWRAANYEPRGMDTNTEQATFGYILNVVPLLVCPQLPNNTCLIGNFALYAEMGLNKDVTVETDKSALFPDNMTAMRVTYKLAISMAQAQAGSNSQFRKSTTTNNWV